MGNISKTSVFVFKKLTKEDIIDILELCGSIPKTTNYKKIGIYPFDFYKELVRNGYLTSGSFSKSSSESIYFFLWNRRG